MTAPVPGGPTDDELLARLADLFDRVDLPPTLRFDRFAHRSGGSR
jgi:hypothetical protein